MLELWLQSQLRLIQVTGNSIHADARQPTPQDTTALFQRIQMYAILTADLFKSPLDCIAVVFLPNPCEYRDTDCTRGQAQVGPPRIW